MVNKHWFAFKQKNGSPIPMGPYSSDQVNIERERAKRPDADVSQWFIADTEQEAQEKADFWLPRSQPPQ